MSGLFGGGNNSTVTPVTGLNIQTSANGLPIPLVYGTTVVTPNLLWYGDFNAVAQSQSSGGKGGSQTTGYLYNASFILALCEGPVSGVLTAYINKAVASPSTYFSIFTGTYPQTPWGYLSSNHAAQAIGYQGIAYAAAAAYSLGSSASLPQHSFEVAGLKILSGSSDADPKDVLNRPG